MIKPTVGRIVLFYPPVTFPGTASVGKPLAALIAYVHSDSCVNLAVFDAKGIVFSQTSVPLIQDGDAAAQNGYFCEWMPYQKGQASNAETIKALIRCEAESVEQEIVRKGLIAPRVTRERIEDLVGRIVITYEVRPNGSTTTLAHAFLDGQFYLATGTSACVSAENFDAELGKRLATQKAMSAAEDELWKLEGYALRQKLAE